MKTTLFLLIFIYSTNSFTQDITQNYKIIDNPVKSKHQVIHENKDLNQVIKLREADTFPVFNKCENKPSQNETLNCLNTELIKYCTNRIDKSEILKNTNLKKGVINIRTIFIVDQNGKLQLKKVLGNWSKKITSEINRVFNTAPNLIPATVAGNNIAVKYTIRIPFKI